MALTFYDEMHDARAKVRQHHAFFDQWSRALPPEVMTRKRAEADLAFRRLGIIFAVYGEEAGTERLIPFDTIPRIIPHAEWKTLRTGLKQLARSRATDLAYRSAAGQPRLVGADASHAWGAVFVPDLGWVEFDPTNDCFADQRYLILGWGRDFGDVSPIRGVIQGVIQGGGEHELNVGVTVTPFDELSDGASAGDHGATC